MKRFLILILLLSGCTLNKNIQPIQWDNELSDGRLMYGKVATGTEIFIDNSTKNNGTEGLYQIPTKEGHFVVGIPQDTNKLKLKIKQNGQMKDISFNVPQRKWKEDYVSGLPPKKVTPPAEEQKRIQAEFKAMRDKRQLSTYPQFPFKWQQPLGSYKRISSPFGSRRILNGSVKQNGHSGTDYAADTGTPVLAAADGIVVLTHPDMFYTGKTILVDHGYGVYTSYAHLSQIDVAEGQIVKAGDIIGAVGMSGRATGPHLHFGVSWYGVRVSGEDLFSD